MGYMADWLGEEVSLTISRSELISVIAAIDYLDQAPNKFNLKKHRDLLLQAQRRMVDRLDAQQ